MIVVDSSVWIGMFRNHRTPKTEWLAVNAGNPVLRTADLSICEILRGARPGREFEAFKRDLAELAILETGGFELAVDAAERYSWLRTKGITIRSTIHCIIATACLQRGYELLHDDRDFDPFAKYLGLRVFHVE